MLQRSKRNAILIDAAANLVVAATILALSLVSQYRSTGSIPPFSGGEAWLLLALVVVIYIVASVVGGLLMHAVLREQVHYGLGGLARWACLGLIYGITYHLSSVESSPLEASLRTIIHALVVILAYLVLFKLLPALRSKGSA